MDSAKTVLDPFRVIVGWLEAQADADRLRRVANSAGLVFDTTLEEKEKDDWSAKYQQAAEQRWIRALVPRIFAAYESKDDQARLVVARAAIASLGAPPELVERLARIGWGIEGDELFVTTADLREMFFPKGSQWDAFKALKDFFAIATKQITVVDPFADGTVFELLATRTALTSFEFRVLSFDRPDRIASEARRFRNQHAGVVIEVRCAKEFHDRFLLIDGAECIHVGASLNHAGKTGFLISRVEDEAIRNAITSAIEASWTGADKVD